MRVFRQHVRTTGQFWLLVRMLVWSVGLLVLRPFVPVQRLVWLAIPTRTKGNVQADNVLRYLQWLDGIGVLARSGGCLVRALVCHRYLTFAGMNPALLIGFDGKKGHSWVEIAGEAIHESEGALRRYRPTLVAPPGHRKLVKAIR